ncbi:MAG: 16S rRNA (uracil(1498)-N(3))-methyltransferase [Nitrospirae bacterium]|nr:16S rRNA (uracil(1498)-N(3))-methyltransferase [Nitrospirota bacterium]
MPRIFIQPELITADSVTLPEAEARRLARVLRMKPGDSVTLFDGAREYDTAIESISTKSVTLRIVSTTVLQDPVRLKLTLGQGVPKGEKLEWVVQKAVELGVSTVIPVLMERSVRRPDREGAVKAQSRLRRIATEAAQQSGRVSVPEVPDYMDLREYLEATKDADVKVVFYEGAKSEGLRALLRSAGPAGSVALLVGPEGGLTQAEVDEAVEAGYAVAGLGPRILRTETAAVAALAIVQYELGDVG